MNIVSRASALGNIGRAQAEVDTQRSAHGAEQKQKDAARDPYAVQQFPIGVNTL